MDLEYTLYRFNNVRLNQRDSMKLRGYIANRFKHYLLHHHVRDKILYRYPLVQYKVIDGNPIIIGINEGAKLVVEIGVNNNELIIDELSFSVNSYSIMKDTVYIGETPDYVHYRFISPWLALNEKNYELYKNSNSIEQEELLKRLLIGNILSMCKGIGYNVKHELKCWLNVDKCLVNYKDIKMIGFKGEFKVNFDIPDYLGLGKAVSRGFGTIEKI